MKLKTVLNHAILGSTLTLSLLQAGQTIAADIRAASCFPEGHYFSKRFEAAVESLRANGVSVDYVGGAPAIGSPFTLVQKMSRGAYDMVNCTGAYYQNVLPAADALKMLETSPADSRADGSYAYIQEMHRSKNIEYVARMHSGEKFHLYLAPEKAISKPDLSGLHLRVAPTYQAFFSTLGATTQKSNMAQIYTYMETGTVMGYGWPVTGILPDWHKVTGHRVDPGFYDVDIHILFNARSFQKLSADKQALVQQSALAEEEKGWIAGAANTVKALARQDADGIKSIRFNSVDEAFWVSQAKSSAWDAIEATNPEHGPMLRALMSK